MIEPGAADSGFTLLEVVCVLATIAMIAAILMPAFPRQTSRSRLEAYAFEAAALLKQDRSAAIRKQRQVDTAIDSSGRSVRSGSAARIVQLPNDITFETVLPRRCRRQLVFSSISFLPTGMSCGGTIILSRPGSGFEIRVNWLTGNIDVTPRS